MSRIATLRMAGQQLKRKLFSGTTRNGGVSAIAYSVQTLYSLVTPRNKEKINSVWYILFKWLWQSKTTI